MGRSAFYRWYIDSPGWKARVEAVWSRAIRFSGANCELCLRRPGREVHHACGYRDLGREPIDSLLLCCHQCHLTLSGLRTADPSPADIRRYWFFFDSDDRGFLPLPD